MTYITDEKSIEGSAPIELYKFDAAGTTYRYNSSRETVTYAANDWTPATLQRSPIDIPTLDDPQDLIIDIPVSDAFVQAYGLQYPPQVVTCSLYRWQTVSAAAVLLWQGKVGAFATSGRLTRVRVASMLGDTVGLSIPNRHFQRQCNNLFTDEMCGILQSAVDYATTVSSFSGKTVVVGAVGAGKTYKFGKIQRDSDGEWRFIVNQVGTTLTIDYPFRTLVVGDAVTLVEGCDRLVQTCFTRYANVANFTGHPFVPEKDIFRTGLRGNDSL